MSVLLLFVFFNFWRAFFRLLNDRCRSSFSCNCHQVVLNSFLVASRRRICLLRLLFWSERYIWCILLQNSVSLDGSSLRNISHWSPSWLRRRHSCWIWLLNIDCVQFLTRQTLCFYLFRFDNLSIDPNFQFDATCNRMRILLFQMIVLWNGLGNLNWFDTLRHNSVFHL